MKPMTLIFSLRSQPTTLLMVNGIISQKCWFSMLEVCRTKFLTYNPCCSDSFDIIALTETWLDGNYQDCEFNLDGYVTCLEKIDAIVEAVGFF